MAARLPDPDESVKTHFSRSDWNYLATHPIYLLDVTTERLFRSLSLVPRLAPGQTTGPGQRL